MLSVGRVETDTHYPQIQRLAWSWVAVCTQTPPVAIGPFPTEKKTMLKMYTAIILQGTRDKSISRMPRAGGRDIAM